MSPTLAWKTRLSSNKTQNHNPANQRTTLSYFGGLRYWMYLDILRFFAPWAYHTVTTLIYWYCFPHVSRRRILHFWICVLTLIFRRSSPSFSWSPNVDRVFTFGTPLSGRARNALSAKLFLFWIVGSGRAERQSIRTHLGVNLPAALSTRTIPLIPSTRTLLLIASQWGVHLSLN